MTTDQLTRKGARQLTSAIDRVAECVQLNHTALGIDPKIAVDFAYRCDLISDAVETTAVTNHPLDKSAEYAADEIGAETKGPIYEEDSDPDLKGQFTQKEFQQLTDEVEGSSSPAGVANAKKLAGAVDAVLAAENSLELITAMETLNTELNDESDKVARGKLPGYSPMQLKQEIDRLSSLRQEITTHAKQFEDVIKRLKALEKEEKAGLAALKKAAGQMREKGKYVFEAEQSLLEFTAYLSNKTPGIAQMIENPNDPKSKYGDKAGDMFGRIAGQLGQEVADQVAVIYAETKEDLTHVTMAVRGLKIVQKTASLPAGAAKTAGLADIAVGIKDWLAGGLDRAAQKILGFMGDVSKWLKGFVLRTKMVRGASGNLKSALDNAEKSIDGLFQSGRAASVEEANTDGFNLLAE
jgi:hypothetical protein|tara:strand:- start:1007 stop:2236 length:1230 start_codon:yes stop_codon:yes gene_type:complete